MLVRRHKSADRDAEVVAVSEWIGELMATIDQAGHGLLGIVPDSVAPGEVSSVG